MVGTARLVNISIRKIIPLWEPWVFMRLFYLVWTHGMVSFQHVLCQSNYFGVGNGGRKLLKKLEIVLKLAEHSWKPTVCLAGITGY